MHDAKSRHERIAAATALEWEWDTRFGMALAAFDFERADAIQAALASELPHRFMAHDLAAAPQRTRDFAQQLGGMRGGQILFTSSDADPVMVVCAWWPWGNGKRFSIRLGCDAGSDLVQQARVTDELRGWYGV